MWQKLFLWSKKIHNLAMWGVVAIGLFMMTSGMAMHRELEGEWLPKFVDTVFLRQWHNSFSQLFLVLFGVQMVTGLGLWMLPKIIRNRAR